MKDHYEVPEIELIIFDKDDEIVTIASIPGELGGQDED